MKVLMLGWEFPPHISGGLGTACAGLTRALARQGEEIVFVLPRAHGDEEAAHLELVGAQSTPGGMPGIEHIAIASPLQPYLAPRSFGGGYGPDLLAEVERYAEAVGALAARRSFDVIHAHDWMTVPAALAAAAASGRPFVFHVHSCEHDRSGEHVDPRVVALEQLGLERAERVVCVSHYTAAILESRYRIAPGKLSVVHNAVETRARAKRLRPSKPFGEPLVLFLGRITHQKGPEWFLAYAAEVVRTLPRVKFVLSGSGDLFPAVVEQSARLGLARHVHFTGFLRGREVERMYAMADLYVMPSVSEPFGLAPMEALALDTPVILSRQSGAAEVLTDVPRVDFWDVHGMARRIVAILGDAKLARSIARRGRAQVRKLSWQSSAARVRAVYRECLA